MSKNKMSQRDKIKRLEEKILASLDDPNDFIKEAKTIRDKSLRSLLALEYDMMINHSIPLYDINAIMDELGCKERAAYDYLKMMLFLHSIYYKFQDDTRHLQAKLVAEGK